MAPPGLKAGGCLHPRAVHCEADHTNARCCSSTQAKRVGAAGQHKAPRAARCREVRVLVCAAEADEGASGVPAWPASGVPAWPAATGARFFLRRWGGRWDGLWGTGGRSPACETKLRTGSITLRRHRDAEVGQGARATPLFPISASQCPDHGRDPDAVHVEGFSATECTLSTHSCASTARKDGQRVRFAARCAKLLDTPERILKDAAYASVLATGRGQRHPRRRAAAAVVRSLNLLLRTCFSRRPPQQRMPTATHRRPLRAWKSLLREPPWQHQNAA